MTRPATRPAFLALLLLPACATLEQGRPVTPQRPTYSSDTNTTAEGTTELEAGLAVSRDGDFSSPDTLKYGAGARTELFVGVSPFNVVERPGDDGVGFGDLQVGVRHRFWEGDDGLSFAGRVAGKLPTADESEGLGSGEPDVLVAAIAAQTLGSATALVGYYEYGALGDPSGGGAIDQHAFALAGSHAFDQRWGLGAELASIHSKGSDVTFTTWYGTYAVQPSLVLDAGIAAGLTDDAEDLLFQIGMTWNFGPVGQAPGRTGAR